MSDTPPLDQNQRKLNLALQGGGAHGAFTWGVLDRLLDETRLDIRALSGTSAGGVNAVVAVYGYEQGGRPGAQKALRALWEDIAQSGEAFMMMWQGAFAHFKQDDWNLENSPGYIWFEILTRFMSPYEFNPLNLNPLRDLLNRHVNFTHFDRDTEVDVFLTATNVHTGQPRVFKTRELSVDVVLASACLPTLYRAVEIDGVPYWDGGYMGNPSLWPLYYDTFVNDILLVQLNPLYRETTPRTSAEIDDRLNEITFNASLIAEMRAIEFVQRLIRKGQLDNKIYRDVRLHCIHPGNDFNQLGASSKVNTRLDFLEWMHDKGHRAADLWLQDHFQDIGVKQTVDIAKDYLGKQSR